VRFAPSPRRASAIVRHVRVRWSGIAGATVLLLRRAVAGSRELLLGDFGSTRSACLHYACIQPRLQACTHINGPDRSPGRSVSAPTRSARCTRTCVGRDGRQPLPRAIIVPDLLWSRTVSVPRVPRTAVGSKSGGRSCIVGLTWHAGRDASRRHRCLRIDVRELLLRSFGILSSTSPDSAASSRGRAPLRSAMRPRSARRRSARRLRRRHWHGTRPTDQIPQRASDTSQTPTGTSCRSSPASIASADCDDSITST